MIPLLYKIYFSTILISAIYFLSISTLPVYSHLCIFLLINSYYTLGEYIIHKYLFHDMIKEIHKKHHDDPMKYYRLFIPIRVTVFNDILLFLFGWTFFHDYLLPIMASAHLSYLLFEYCHYSSHYKNCTFLPPRRLIAFHHLHHFNERGHFGFTTPFWDIVFGTTTHTFPLSYYPLSFLPISVISFLSIK